MGGGRGDDGSWDCCPVVIAAVVLGGLRVYTSVACAYAVEWCLGSVVRAAGNDRGLGASFAGATSDG